ncbi:hypothetical protein [Maritimibacter sp. DP1N21-5]|uniref:hypothetical protein n=1 Tax=Maritimibacter sp. DP1N21-5 TaxID=2836867 RepID=UPI001C4724F8|nr:hypothetical protein [Maritimibacter sp. DP1N21-5]MBV7408713.1 hypothetical protein [Maritimibacter sp. DP1N21-5]
MSNYRDIQDMPSGVHEALWQMFKDGPIWDGNLVCKTSRKWLRENGYADQSSGHNFLTAMGVDLAVSLGMGDRKDRRGAQGGEE